MAREKKVNIVASLEETFSRCNIGILTDYRGLSASEMTELRRRLREAGVEYRVVKNTLARLAVRGSEVPGLDGLFEGPTAVVFGYGDISEAAKSITSYIQTNKSVMSVKGGFLPDRLLSAAEVNSLATLPPREILIANVLGGIQTPLWALVSCLSAPLTGFIGVLQARIQQLEEG